MNKNTSSDRRPANRVGPTLDFRLASWLVGLALVMVVICGGSVLGSRLLGQRDADRAQTLDLSASTATGVAIAAEVSSTPTSTPEPTATLAPTSTPTATPRPPARQCPFSVNIWPYKEIPNQASQAEELQICWTRVAFYWDRIEPAKTSPRTYNWDVVDTQVLSLAEAGINPVAMIAANPPWAAAYPGGPVTDTHDLLDFLTAAAERYDGDGVEDAPGSPLVPVWELYNEPDNKSPAQATYRGWGYWGGQGEAYAQLMAQARAALRQSNPNALLAMGGLAHEYIAEDIFDLDFPHQILKYIRDHPGEYFDFFNFHFFPVFGPLYSKWGPDVAGKAAYFRNMMEQYGQSWPIIATETGFWSAGDAAPPWTGSPEDQARYVVQLYSRSLAADLHFTAWLLLFDLTPPPADKSSLPLHDNYRGLSDVNGVPKPAYNAYRTLIDKLGQAHFERALSKADLGTTRAEGYAFSRANGAGWVYVVWATRVGGGGVLDVAAASVTVSDKLSGQWPMTPALETFDPYVVNDADDGQQDGHVKIKFGDNPIYVEVHE